MSVMSNVTIVKGDLFTAPKGSIICHACNTYGAWGAGIAKQFANRYPDAYKIYKQFCDDQEGFALHQCLLIDAGDLTIGCLFTSWGYGAYVDKPERVLKATYNSIDCLIRQNTGRKPIHMCKINSGLFGVKWELTQEVLEKFPEQKFTVYEL
jgi:ADP-ribose 1''-phosphate phosphatase